MQAAIPDVSVVIGTYNGGDKLIKSLDSILEQSGVDFEVIVVDDGSTDTTAEYLAELQETNKRVRVFRQERNSGLTLALILGCSEAKGKYIARQDVGDRSLPGRLQKQFAYMEDNSDIVLSSCWIKTVGPQNEPLSVTRPMDTASQATANLKRGLFGVTHHGATMFRRDAYNTVGGYRSEFYFAQDLDLWYRLALVGNQAFIREELYEITITPSCISSRHRDQQIKLAAIIHKLNNPDITDENKYLLLQSAAEVRPNHVGPNAKAEIAGMYWIGNMLARRGDMRALNYFASILQKNPFLFKAWIAIARLLVIRCLYRTTDFS